MHIARTMIRLRTASTNAFTGLPCCSMLTLEILQSTPELPSCLRSFCVCISHLVAIQPG